MSIIELRLSKCYFYWSLYSKKLNGNCKEVVFQYWCFYWVFIGVFIQCCVSSYRRVCEIQLKSGSPGVIIGVVELLQGSIKIFQTKFPDFSLNFLSNQMIFP